MEHECDVKHFGCKFLPKIDLSNKTDLERCQLLGSTKYGHVLAANEMGKNYNKLSIHIISLLMIHYNSINLGGNFYK